MINITKKNFTIISILLLLIITVTWNIPIKHTFLGSENNQSNSFEFEVREKNSTSLNSRHINLNNGNDYEVYFKSDNEDVKKYCLTLIIDGEQREIITSSPNKNIFIEPDYIEGNIISFKFPDISPGFSQGMFILKPIVDNDIKNPPEIFTSRFSLEGVIKKELKVENNIKLNHESTNISNSERILDFRGITDFAVIQSKDINDPIIKIRDNHSLKNNPSFEIYLLNEGFQNTSYMILAFVNEKQYMINNKKYILIDLEQGEDKSFNTSLNLNSEDINKEIVFYAIPNPYMLYDNKSFDESWDKELDIYTKISTRYIITE